MSIVPRLDYSLKIGRADESVSFPPFEQGVFFEDYNHGGDGGVYAELVRNRSFEDPPEQFSWSLQVQLGAFAQMSLDTSLPLNEHNPTSLRLDIRSPEGSRVELINEGFWGMAIKAGFRYNYSFYFRCTPGFQGSFAVEFCDTDGARLAEMPIQTMISEQWHKVNGVIVSPVSHDRARFGISVSGVGSIWFDMVSLFPEDTWPEPGGVLRRDIAEWIAGLKPLFMRFPGGTNLEGYSPEGCLRWKNSIGDLAKRPGVMQCWGYRLTEGIGMFELFDWCEKLNAEPLFTINAGLMAQWKTDIAIPMEELGEWVQDALDAIEYANGPVTSTWGSLRASHGHPASYGLKYILIGNENAGPRYEERFARFYAAIKSNYPDIQVISCIRLPSQTPDLVDEHYYGSPNRLALLAHHFDAYDRSAPKIIVTEYAVTTGGGMGTWEAALAEAAFLTGLERNSDIVLKACYGGLFGNLDDPARCWDPNEIYFNTSQSYAIPSYLVQRMFREYSGDRVLPILLEGGPTPSIMCGRIGLGSHSTDVEYRDVCVSDKSGDILYQTSLFLTSDEWDVWSGMDMVAQDTRYVNKNIYGQDFYISCKACKLGGREGFRIFFRVQDEQNWYALQLGSWGNTRHKLEKCQDGIVDVLGTETSGTIDVGRWYEVRIELDGPTICCFLDGLLLLEYTEPPVIPVSISAVYNSKTRERIVKIVNRSENVQTLGVYVDKTLNNPLTIKRISIEGQPGDGNSVEEPNKVRPVEAPLGRIDREFVYHIPPYSLTALVMMD